jgi:hypothetical protein
LEAPKNVDEINHVLYNTWTDIGMFEGVPPIDRSLDFYQSSGKKNIDAQVYINKEEGGIAHLFWNLHGSTYLEIMGKFQFYVLLWAG